jgi:DNA integrity scanning protein DisA with diadenylate cyclase activity
MFDQICKMIESCQSQVLEQTIQLAVEVAREGREGSKVGTIFVVGDEEAVMKESSPLILDPLQGHPPESKKIDDFNMRETAKELSQLDGAFVISADGIVISAARYLTADSTGIAVPLGLGTRHMAAAAITRTTQSVAVVVSKSSVVRVFNQGKIIGEIIPEIWMLGRESIQVAGPYLETKGGGLHIVACDLPDKAEKDNRNGS